MSLIYSRDRWCRPSPDSVSLIREFFDAKRQDKEGRDVLVTRITGCMGTQEESRASVNDAESQLLALRAQWQADYARHIANKPVRVAV